MVIIKLRIKSADEWRELAGAQAAPGGVEPMFVPTTDALTPQQAVIVEISSQLLPNKVLVRGTVQSWRPALPRMRVRAGATIDPASDEATKLEFLHDVFSGRRPEPPRRRHARMPLQIAVRYRLANSAAYVDEMVNEIGVGGALLATREPLPLESELTLEIVPPGAAAPLAIASRVSYHVPSGGTGLRFLSRDADGERRLRELIRRLRAS
ncbi:MAG TPA: PilZ domain-containing protein [Kofleriaceae bacterium]|jgi:hypothetical protein